MSKLLAEYIGLLLNERGYIRDLNHEKPKKKNKGFLQKIKGFIFGDAEADKIAESWLEDNSISYDIVFDEKFEEEVKNFVRSKLNKIMKRVRNNSEKAESLLRRALNVRYSKKLANLIKIQDDQIDETKV